ncbi:MAG TPA: alpha/beta fold hydrolase [Actinomycetota bacterium]
MSEVGRFVAIDDTSLWIVERGADEDLPLLVLHGGPGLDHHEFGDYLDPLTERGIRLVLVDLRSCGRSERTPERTWTLERHAQDVVMLARAMQLDRYAVLGHSYGAFVALQNAVDFPGAAAAVIVSGGVASTRYLDRVEENLEAFEPEELRAQVQASWDREPHVSTADEFRELMRDQFPFHFADPLDPRIEEYLERTRDTVYSPDVLRHFAAAGYGSIEVEDRLDEVISPVLVLAGLHDRTCVFEAAEVIAAGIDDAQLVLFEQSGHMTFVEENEEFIEAVARFVGTPG